MKKYINKYNKYTRYIKLPVREVYIYRYLGTLGISDYKIWENYLASHDSSCSMIIDIFYLNMFISNSLSGGVNIFVEK